jgi:3-hydroxyisobutyrate dehydrogenase-like beta-hydroxyacid dehydrogenase
MGSRLAGRLLDAGHTVHGTNRTRAKAEPLIEGGMTWMDSPREVAASADVTFSMVTDDDALAAIAEGPDGLLAGLAPGSSAST